MRPAARRVAAVLSAATLGALMLAGCVGGESTATSGPEFAARIKKRPCDVFTQKSITSLLSPELRRNNWPRMETGKGSGRIGGDMLRCSWRLTPENSKRDGDQALVVIVYNELGNGGPLMSACRARPLKTATPIAIGDESCVDDSGQVRFRVGDAYASVRVDIPPRTLSGVWPLTSSDTSTFVARSSPEICAAFARPVAENLAKRLR